MIQDTSQDIEGRPVVDLGEVAAKRAAEEAEARVAWSASAVVNDEGRLDVSLEVGPALIALGGTDGQLAASAAKGLIDLAFGVLSGRLLELEARASREQA